MPDRIEFLKIKLDIVYRGKDRAASEALFTAIVVPPPVAK